MIHNPPHTTRPVNEVSLLAPVHRVRTVEI